MEVPPDVCANESLRRCTILLVEDEPFVRYATCSILKSVGFDVLPTEDAPEAINAYENCQRRIDLVMTDMVLPGKSGRELSHYLRNHSPELLILLTSGYCHPQFEAEMSESHIHFLAKPYSKKTLIDKIDKILDSVRLVREPSQSN
jgi:CheY-like chemotaxis protein